MASNRTVAVLAVVMVAGMAVTEYAMAKHWIPEFPKAAAAAPDAPAATSAIPAPTADGAS